MKRAVVLAGGEGLRLRPLTIDKPKAMLAVSGKPLLEWIIRWLKANGISHVVVGVAYKKEIITDYFGDGKRLGVEISYSEHTVEGGTSEGFRLAIERHVPDHTFIAMNGDELVDLDLSSFVKFHVAKGGIATIAVGPLRSPFGLVELLGNDVTEFREKPILQSHYVSVGTYVFSRAILNYLPDRGDVERTAFPSLASMRKLKAYIHNGFWATINTAKDLEDVEKQLKEKRW